MLEVAKVHNESSFRGGFKSRVLLVERERDRTSVRHPTGHRRARSDARSKDDPNSCAFLDGVVARLSSRAKTQSETVPRLCCGCFYRDATFESNSCQRQF